VKFGGKIEIASTVKEFRRSSFDVEHRISNQGQIAVEGHEHAYGPVAARTTLRS